jgi:predicted metal-dependent phosphoesterase TrpH
MGRVDLHLHTTYSDGTQTPEALVADAAARGVALIAITDHDEIGGIAPAQAVGVALGVRVLSGVEINTEVGREHIHILGYGFPTDAPALREGLGTLRAARVERLRTMLGRLAALGYPLDEARVLAIAGHGSVGRPHLARALLEAGYVTDVRMAFDRLIGNRGPAYVPRTAYRPEAAIALIHQAGGLASLAHPGKLGDPVRIINTLKEAGLDALEAYHSDHPPAVTARMLRYAGNFSLLVTGGSDSHGPDGPRIVPVGAVDVPDAVGECLLQALGMV